MPLDRHSALINYLRYGTRFPTWAGDSLEGSTPRFSLHPRLTWTVLVPVPQNIISHPLFVFFPMVLSKCAHAEHAPAGHSLLSGDRKEGSGSRINKGTWWLFFWAAIKRKECKIALHAKSIGSHWLDQYACRGTTFADTTAIACTKI